MKNLKTTFVLSILAMVLVLPQQASAQFKISGEFRPRTEMYHGYKALADSGQQASTSTSQRTRLDFNYKSEKFATGLTLQDVRRWGSQPQLVGNEANAASIHEAWAEVFFSEKFSLKAGRQELVYDDHRIFGSVGWAQQARSHDVAVFKYNGPFSAHLGLAYNENGAITNNLYDGPDAYKSMQFLWLNKKSEKLNVSFLFLNNGKPYATKVDTSGNAVKQVVKFSQTIGPRIVYKAGNLTAAFNAYYQMGLNAANKQVSAYEVAVDLGYKVNDNIGLNAGYEMLSGQSKTDTTAAYNNIDHAFTPFYGTNHKFNGFMDYFYVGNHGGNVGLQDIYLKAGYKKEKISANLHAHIFMSAADILDTDALVETGAIKAMSPYLGTEIDFFVGYTVAKGVAIKAGYSQMLGTESMVALKGGDIKQISNWAWLMLVVKPTFLDTAPKKEEPKG